MLPLVRAITGDMVRLAYDVLGRRERLSQIREHREEDSSDLYGDEVVQIEQELEADVERLREFAAELSQLGVESKGAAEGLVDFPAEMDGRIVQLCWRYDEPEVLFWHELNAGFAGRQPLTVGSLSSEDGGDVGGLQES